LQTFLSEQILIAQRCLAAKDAIEGSGPQGEIVAMPSNQLSANGSVQTKALRLAGRRVFAG